MHTHRRLLKVRCCHLQYLDLFLSVCRCLNTTHTHTTYFTCDKSKCVGRYDRPKNRKTEFLKPIFDFCHLSCFEFPRLSRKLRRVFFSVSFYWKRIFCTFWRNKFHFLIKLLGHFVDKCSIVAIKFLTS